MNKRELRRAHSDALSLDQSIDEARAALSLSGLARALACTRTLVLPPGTVSKQYGRAHKTATNIPRQVQVEIRKQARQEAATAYLRRRRWGGPWRYASIPGSICEEEVVGRYGSLGWRKYEYHALYAVCKYKGRIYYWIGTTRHTVKIIGQYARVGKQWIRTTGEEVKEARPIKRGLPRALRKAIERAEPGVRWRGQVAYSLDGQDYHCHYATSPSEVVAAWQQRRTEKRHALRDAALLDFCRTNLVWVEFSDSIKAGNCPAGTRNLADDLGFPESLADTELVAPAAWLLEQTDTSYTRRACIAAALRSQRESHY